jgi:hypothetical protein
LGRHDLGWWRLAGASSRACAGCCWTRCLAQPCRRCSDGRGWDALTEEPLHRVADSAALLRRQSWATRDAIGALSTLVASASRLRLRRQDYRRELAPRCPRPRSWSRAHPALSVEYESGWVDSSCCPSGSCFQSGRTTRRLHVVRPHRLRAVRSPTMRRSPPVFQMVSPATRVNRRVQARARDRGAKTKSPSRSPVYACERAHLSGTARSWRFGCSKPDEEERNAGRANVRWLMWQQGRLVQAQHRGDGGGVRGGRLNSTPRCDIPRSPLDIYRNRPDALFEDHFARACRRSAARGRRPGSAQSWVTSQRQLACDENAHARDGVWLRRCQEKRCFSQIHLDGDGLDFCFGKTSGVQERQPVDRRQRCDRRRRPARVPTRLSPTSRIGTVFQRSRREET